MLVSVSVIGLKSNFPEIAIAATISGEVTKACVFGFPSARFAKFLLNECTIEFFSCFSAPSRAHCPIHGPQAFVKIRVPVNLLNVSIRPSRSAVNRTCSEPGLIPKIALGCSPFSTASATIDAARDKSSYDEFVHDPIKAHSISVGQSFAAALSFISATGVAKSGVKGPLMWGVNSSKLISITWSKYCSGFA